MKDLGPRQAGSESFWGQVYPELSARLAQLEEHFTCNEEVVGSSPTAGSALALLRGFGGPDGRLLQVPVAV
jgi:hypothetical protein